MSFAFPKQYDNYYDTTDILEKYKTELICISCRHRFTYSICSYEKLKSIKCPKCEQIGYIIKTGENNL